MKCLLLVLLLTVSSIIGPSILFAQSYSYVDNNSANAFYYNCNTELSQEESWEIMQEHISCILQEIIEYAIPILLDNFVYSEDTPYVFFDESMIKP